MDAVILVGGLGTRLRPLTETVPKPLLPILNVPMIDRVIAGLPPETRRVVLAMGYRSEQMEEHFARRWGAARGGKARPEVVLVTEKEPLGTGGALKHVERHLEGRFLMLNGDILSSLDISKMVRHHEKAGGVGTLALWQVEDPSAFGVVALDPTGRITQFKEKPKRGEAPSNLISAGVYVLEPEVLGLLRKGKAASIERDVFPKLISRGLIGHPFSGYWVDAGKPADYLRANWLLLPRTRVAPTSAVDPTATLEDPSLVPSDTVVRRFARIGPRVSLGVRCDVGESAWISESVLFGGVHIGRKARVTNSIVGASARIGDGATLDGCLVGDLTEIPAGARHKDETLWEGFAPAPRT